MSLQKLENEYVKIVLNPEIGGKIISLFSKRSGTEYLLGSPIDSPATPKYGDPFDKRFAYGFDECFPTIKACQLQTGKGLVKLPDHGELWSRPWEYHQKGDSIVLSIKGKKLDYLFTREIKLSGAGLEFNYLLKNNSDTTLEYLWSAHPLLSAEENDLILMEKNCGKVVVYWATDKTETGTECTDWPPKAGKQGSIDLSIVQNIDTNIAMKLFSNESDVRSTGLYKSTANESLVFSLDQTKLPYFGIWLCYGGWPVDQEEKSLTVALEPTNAQTDSLTEAIRNNEVARIKSNNVHQWSFQCTLVRGKAFL